MAQIRSHALMTTLSLLVFLAGTAFAAQDDDATAPQAGGTERATGDAAADQAPTSWSQWRGSERDSRVVGTAWPDNLDDKALGVAWSKDFGPSYSGPILSDTMVFTTETRDKKKEIVTALDRRTGEVVWRYEWDGAMKVPFFANANGSWIRATPAFDGERLYVGGMRDVLQCLDAATGEPVWRIDFVAEFGTAVPSFGFVSSPLVDGDHVYVQAGASFIKLDKRSGKVVWRTSKDAGGMNGSTFSSPIIATLAGTRQLVVQTRSHLKGIAEGTGEELWAIPIKSFRGMAILTPTIHGDGIFMSAHSGVAQLLEVKKSESGFAVTPKWSNKLQAYMSSPVIHDGHAYMHLRNQRFCCIDLATGEEKWRTEPYGKYWSMVIQDDTILALDERGDLYLIRANPEKFEVLASRHVSDSPTWAHLAVNGSEVYVRALDRLIAMRFLRERAL